MTGILSAVVENTELYIYTVSNFDNLSKLF